MEKYGQNAINAMPKDSRPLTRIESHIEIVKDLTARLEATTDRIVQHARSLGYFEPPGNSGAGTPSPVVTTMTDAIQALQRAVDHCSGSLNLFD